MSGQHPPVECKKFKRLLKELKFEPDAQGATSHENWRGFYAGKKRLVTVDCPKAPFTGTLLSYMLNQIGISKKEFYRVLSSL